MNDTQTMKKEPFRRTMPNRFHSEIDYMIEILNSYDVPTARKQNTSFDYFAEKYRL